MTVIMASIISRPTYSIYCELVLVLNMHEIFATGRKATNNQSYQKYCIHLKELSFIYMYISL